MAQLCRSIYENRFREMELVNEQLNEDVEWILKAAALDETQEDRIKQEFAREYRVITSEERLEAIAEEYCLPLYGTRTPRQGDGHLDRQSHRPLRCMTR